MVASLLAQQEQERQALRILLDARLDRARTVFAQRQVMAGTPSYLTSMTLEQVSSTVQLSIHMPLLRNRVVEGTTEVVIDEETIDLILQRPLDWTRRTSLAAYLAGRKHHKFPPIVVVASQSWVDDPASPEWDEGGRARQDSLSFVALDSRGLVGLVDLHDVDCYALDGQHRVLGAEGLMELVRHGSITRYSKNGTRLDEVDSAADFMRTYGIDESSLRGTVRESMGVELIPAVCKGETREEARRRVRSVFVHTNRMAVILTKGQMAQLDEDDGFAIVARRLAVEHPFLRRKHDRNPRVNWNSPTISAKATVVTTLQTLHEMAYWYLRWREPFGRWRPEGRGLVPLRPDDDELDHGKFELSRLWDAVAELPSMDAVEKGLPSAAFRRFTHERPAGAGHMLFRPLGQVALAQAVGLLLRDGESLSVVFRKLAAWDNADGFNLDRPGSLWWGVLYDPLKRRMLMSGRDLAARLLVYLVSGRGDIEGLRDELIEHRTLEKVLYGFEGKPIASREFMLPEPIQDPGKRT